MGKLTIEYVGIDEITPYENNPRKNLHAVAEVADSIRRYGWRQPIVVDADKVIIVGHTRYQAAQQLGEKQVPIHVASDLSEQEIKAYRIVDNASSESSMWDFDKLLEEMGSLEVSGDTWERLDGYIEEFLANPSKVDQLQQPVPVVQGHQPAFTPPDTPERKPSQEEDDSDKELLDMRGHSFYDGADGGDEKTTPITQFTVGKRSIPVSPEEEARLHAAMAKHNDIYGSYFGFVNRLIRGEYKDV